MTAEQAELRAALAVSALLPEERRWLEARLSAEERAKLERAVGRIDGEALSSVAARLDAPARPDDDGGDAGGLAGRLPQLLLALAAEPAWMLTSLGHALGEDLRARVLAMADADDDGAERAAEWRRHWQDCPAQPAPALRKHLLRALAARAAACPAPERTVPAARGFWARLRETLHG